MLLANTLLFPCLFFIRKQPPDQVVIFSHGNAEDLGAVEGWLRELTNICDVCTSVLFF